MKEKSDKEKNMLETLDQLMDGWDKEMQGKALDNNFPYIFSKAFTFLKMGPERYRKSDFFKQPPGELSAEELDVLALGCRQVLEGRGLTADLPFVNLEISGFYDLFSMFHYKSDSRVSTRSIGADGNKGIMDSITFTHVVDGNKVTYYNFCSMVSFTDNSDAPDDSGNTPNAVVIGEQEWTTQNLDTSFFQNGEEIPEAISPWEWEKAAEDKKPAWCYYDNNPENGKKYGKLYNWYAVSDERGLAPTGWRIPTLSDWEVLCEFVGEDSFKKLAGGNEWQEPNFDWLKELLNRMDNPEYIAKNREIEEDFHQDQKVFSIEENTHSNLDFNVEDGTIFAESQDQGQNKIESAEMKESNDEDSEKDVFEKVSLLFEALPGGSRGQYGNVFYCQGERAYWWTSTPDMERFNDELSEAYFAVLSNCEYEIVVGDSTSKKAGLSVRCVRDVAHGKIKS